MRTKEEKNHDRVESPSEIWFETEKTGGLGFEPRQADPESAVLPLHHPPSQTRKREFRNQRSEFRMGVLTSDL